MLASAFSSNFKPKFPPALGWRVHLMLPSSVVCWQTIDKELFADDTPCTGVSLHNNKYVTNIEQSSSVSRKPRHRDVLSGNKR